MLNILTVWLLKMPRIWAVFPAVGWGIGLAVHFLQHRAWMRRRWPRIQQAERLLGAVDNERGRDGPPQRALADPSWQALMRRARGVLGQLDDDVRKLDDDEAVALDGLGAQLEEGFGQLEKLARGADKVYRALDDATPDGDSGLQRQLEAMDRRIASSDDPRVRRVQQANRDLLEARIGKLDALRAERERLRETGEGFVLALENVRLDLARIGASRLRAGSLRETLDHPDGALAEAIARISVEVDVLREVDEALDDFGGSEPQSSEGASTGPHDE